MQFSVVFLQMSFTGFHTLPLQMLIIQFEELKMSEDESFDSFYSKLNEVVISKFNLGEKTEEVPSIIARKLSCQGDSG